MVVAILDDINIHERAALYKDTGKYIEIKAKMYEFLFLPNINI